MNTAALSPVQHVAYTERFVPEPGQAGTRKRSSESDRRKVLPGRREEAAEYLGEGEEREGEEKPMEQHQGHILNSAWNPAG